MRVVVHHPARTEPEESERTYERNPETGIISITSKIVREAVEVPESKSAFRLGHVTDFTNPITGETTPAAEVVKALVEQAKQEFPDREVSVEYLHVAERHPETDEPVAHEWKDHPPGESVPAGEAHEQTLSAEQGTEVQS